MSTNPAVNPIVGFHSKTCKERTQFNPHHLLRTFEAEGSSQRRGPEAGPELGYLRNEMVGRPGRA